MPEITPAIIRAMRPDLSSPQAVATTATRWRRCQNMHRDTILALALADKLSKLTGAPVEDVIADCAL